jgi:hypothetical protein
MREWLRFRLELQPIPDHAVIGGKALLQDRWDSSRFGSGLGQQGGFIRYFLRSKRMPD